MLNDMEVGDAIVTTGGFYGVIIDITDEDVIVEFVNKKKCLIPIKKASIAEVENASEATAYDHISKNQTTTQVFNRELGWSFFLFIRAKRQK